MSTIKEVLRLKYLGQLSNRKIELLGIASKSAISNYVSRFKKCGLDIHSALALSDEELGRLLYPELKPVSKRKNAKPFHLLLRNTHHNIL